MILTLWDVRWAFDNYYFDRIDANKTCSLLWGKKLGTARRPFPFGFIFLPTSTTRSIDSLWGMASILFLLWQRSNYLWSSTLITYRTTWNRNRPPLQHLLSRSRLLQTQQTHSSAFRPRDDKGMKRAFEVLFTEVAVRGSVKLFFGKARKNIVLFTKTFCMSCLCESTKRCSKL